MMIKKIAPFIHVLYCTRSEKNSFFFVTIEVQLRRINLFSNFSLQLYSSYTANTNNTVESTYLISSPSDFQLCQLEQDYKFEPH